MQNKLRQTLNPKHRKYYWKIINKDKRNEQHKICLISSKTLILQKLK
jgi:hypothetical protein